MASLRDLENPVFVKACLHLSKGIHGIKWAKKVFALAGFRDTMFHQMIEEERLTLSHSLSEEGKRAIIQTVIRIAKETTVDNGPYKWHHPIYGTATIKHGPKSEIGRCFALDVKTDGVYVIEDGGYLMVDPMDGRDLIMENALRQSGRLKLSRLVGYWSNWQPHPAPKEDSLKSFR